MDVDQANALGSQRLRERCGLGVDAPRVQGDESVLGRNLQHLRTLADMPDEMASGNGARDVAQVAIDAAAEKARNVEDASAHGKDV